MMRGTNDPEKNDFYLTNTGGIFLSILTNAIRRNNILEHIRADYNNKYCACLYIYIVLTLTDNLLTEVGYLERLNCMKFIGTLFVVVLKIYQLYVNLLRYPNTVGD